jgi:GNAT superfamily N-acetyltransferase
MKIEQTKQEDLEKIHAFIKEQTPHFKAPLKRFIERESVNSPKNNILSKVVFNEKEEVIGYLSLKDHPFAPSLVKLIIFWIADCEQREEIFIEFIKFAHSNYSQDIISSGVFEDEEWKIKKFKELGYKEHSQMWRSNMNPQSYSEQKNTLFESNDIEIITAREFYQRDEKALEKFYQLEKDIVNIIPADFPMEEMSFEDFKEHKEKSGFSLDLSFFALDGEMLVGLSTAMITNDYAQVMLTGVKKEQQGKGIAFELKQRSILACKEEGFKHLTTMNDSINAPMLNLNSKFGFQKEIAVLRLDKVEGS